MSSNVTLPATGASIATDEVGSAQYQVVKLATGANGVAVPLDAANPLPMGGVRRDADTAFVSDGGAQPLTFNDSGRLKVSVTPADIASTAGSITTNGGIVAIQVKRLSNLAISMVATSLVGHNVSFEASNNSTNGSDGNWYSVQVVRSNANTVEVASGVLAATPVYMWQVNVSDYAYFRVRATAHTSGTAAYILNPSSYVSEPIPAVQVSAVQPVSGTVTVASTVVTASTPATPAASNINSAATTNLSAIKASAGTVYNVSGWNAGADVAYVKLYNKASAPVLASDVPVMVFACPATGNFDHDFGVMGHRFATGIAVAITGGAADTDATAVAAAQVKVATSYV